MKAKKKGRFKKFLLYLVVYICLGTIITVPTLWYLDGYVYRLTQTDEVNPTTKRKTTKEEEEVLKLTLPEDATDVQFSYNNKYYTYLKSGKIYIYSIEDGKEVKCINDTQPICYYNLLYDKNLILYFTQDKGAYASKLVLKTYEIDTERSSEYNEFSINNFSKIKDMNMSPIINMIYINVETKTSAGYINNIVYKIDLFNTMNTVKSGRIIDKLIMLQHKDYVYYQDDEKNIYRGSTLVRFFNEDVDMIGIDENDNLYFLGLESKNKVYKVYNNKLVDTIELKDTAVIETYTNNYGVYIIYEDYIINIAGKNPYQPLGKLSKFVNFEAIKDDVMYLSTPDNIITSHKLIKSDLSEALESTYETVTDSLGVTTTTRKKKNTTNKTTTTTIDEDKITTNNPEETTTEIEKDTQEETEEDTTTSVDKNPDAS